MTKFHWGCYAWKSLKIFPFQTLSWYYYENNILFIFCMYDCFEHCMVNKTFILILYNFFQTSERRVNCKMGWDIPVTSVNMQCEYAAAEKNAVKTHYAEHSGRTWFIYLMKSQHIRKNFNIFLFQISIYFCKIQLSLKAGSWTD